METMEVLNEEGITMTVTNLEEKECWGEHNRLCIDCAECSQRYECWLTTGHLKGLT